MDKQFDALDGPFGMTAESLLALGGTNIAYIKPVFIDGDVGYGIHAGDGTVLAIAETRDVAFAAARQHDLDPVSVH